MIEEVYLHKRQKYSRDNNEKKAFSRGFSNNMIDNRKSFQTQYQQIDNIQQNKSKLFSSKINQLYKVTNLVTQLILPESIKSNEEVYAGVPPLNKDTGLQKLQEIANRNLDAFKCLNKTSELERYTSKVLFGTEWGLGLDKEDHDGEAVLIEGLSGKIEWNNFLEYLLPIGHSHPYNFCRAIKVIDRTTDGMEEGMGPKIETIDDSCYKGIIAFDKINGVNQDQDIRNRTLIFPSSGDIIFCAVNGITEHYVYTPYVVILMPSKIYYVANHDYKSEYENNLRLSFKIMNAACEDEQYTCILNAYMGKSLIWSHVVTTSKESAPTAPCKLAHE